MHDLVESMRDGVSLLKVMNAVQPGVVSWSRANKRPKNKWKRLENLKYAIDVCQQDMELNLVNIGSVDIFNGALVCGGDAPPFLGAMTPVSPSPASPQATGS